MTAVEVAKEVSSLINSMSDGPTEVFLDEMNHDHRTLQQSFTKLCVKWLELQAAKEDGQFDGRNEASIELSKKFVERLDEADRALPFV